MAGVEPADELLDELGSLRPGTRLGRYELLVPVARGGMARVWAARQHGQHGFQKLVAIKTILPELASEGDFEKMFLDEARIASLIHHPNVCEIYELGEDQKTLFLAMEWVSGDSLARVLRPSKTDGALDPRIAARIIADACAGAHAAHEQTDEEGKPLNVVHRDLSPHNVLLTVDGVAKVVDFGVAKALGQVQRHTRAGEVKGKIAYMSPEQITQESLDRRSDVFSLGCVLYEATTGVRPFKGAEHQVMYAILHDELEPPSKVLRNYPPELEKIVLKALSHDPVKRFASAERMRIALEEFLTTGQLVTQSNVAQLIRARLGDDLEKRRERIRKASSRSSDPGLEKRDDQKSGVKPTKTIQMGAVRPPMPKPPGTISMGAVKPPPREAAKAAKVPAATLPPVAPVPPAATLPPHAASKPPAVSSQPAAATAPVTARLVAPVPPKPKGDNDDTTAAASAPVVAPKSLEDLENAETDLIPRLASQRIDDEEDDNPKTLLMTYPQSLHQTLQNTFPAPPTSSAQVLPAAPQPPPSYDQVPMPTPYAMPGPPPQEESMAGQYALAALVGVVLAVLIGGGVFLIWKARTAHNEPPPMTAPP